MQDIKTFIANHKTAILIIGALLLFIGSYFWGRHYATVAVQEAQPVQIPQELTDNINPITKDSSGSPLPLTQQKVDVYKIDLRKDHKIKIGGAYIDGKAYEAASYEQKRLQLIAHAQGKDIKVPWVCGRHTNGNIIEAHLLAMSAKRWAFIFISDHGLSRVSVPGTLTGYITYYISD